MPEWLIGAVSKTVVRLWRTVGSPRRAPVGRIPSLRRKMHWVYVLRSERDGRLYTGATADLDRRLAEHNRGKVRSTARRRPLVLIYSERFDSAMEALDRERFFKTPEGGMLKRRLIEESESRDSMSSD